MINFNNDMENNVNKDYHNFEQPKMENITSYLLQSKQTDNLVDAKKEMSDELLEKLRKNADSIYMLELIGYTEEIIMDLILRYNNYSGLDLLSCIYAIDADNNDKQSYLDIGGPQKKKV